MSRLSQNFANISNSYSGIIGQNAQLNGRVDIVSQMPNFNIPGYEAQTRAVNNDNYANEAIHGQIVANNLTRLFFSPQNIEFLQDGLRYRVYVESNQKYIIGRQSDKELKIIMRSIYLQYSRNLATDCVSQARDLNGKVLDHAVAEVLSNLYQYETYRKDASTLPMPLERSPLMTNKGTRVLEIKSFM